MMLALYEHNAAFPFVRPRFPSRVQLCWALINSLLPQQQQMVESNNSELQTLMKQPTPAVPPPQHKSRGFSSSERALLLS